MCSGCIPVPSGASPRSMSGGAPSLGYGGSPLLARRLHSGSSIALAWRASARVRARFSSWGCLPVHQGGSKAVTNVSPRVSHRRWSCASSPQRSPATLTIWRSASRLLLKRVACRAPTPSGSACCCHHQESALHMSMS